MDKTFVFSEQDTKKLADMLNDCRGVAYYDALVAEFFAQLYQQEEFRMNVYCSYSNPAAAPANGAEVAK